MGIVDAVRYILSIPTNILMIISSSLGYFYFAGLSTFALLFVRGHYHASQATAELVLALLVAGAMVGTLVSGRVTDPLLRRGVLEVRVWVPALCYLGAAALLVPGILGSHLTPAVWFDVAGAALLSAANPPLDAARLDIMPAGLWGRAESTRTVLRSLAQALAPLVFGGLADLIAGIAPEQAPIGTHPGVISPGAARGLRSASCCCSGRSSPRACSCCGRGTPTRATWPPPRRRIRDRTIPSPSLRPRPESACDRARRPRRPIRCFRNHVGRRTAG